MSAPEAPATGVPTEAGVKLALERGDTAPSYAVERTASAPAAGAAQRSTRQPTSANDAPLSTSATDDKHPHPTGSSAEPEPGKGKGD
jgi:NADH-quinone oxidoreductase subunit E